MDNLYEICKKLGIDPKLCLEIGAAHVTTSQLRDFVNNGVECILFEPNPRLFYCLQEGYNNDNGKNFIGTWPKHPEPPFDNKGWKDLPNVKLYNVAIFDKEGEINIFERNASSFIEGVVSPAIVNDGYKEDLKDGTLIKCNTIDKYDNGNIDLLCADCEGCEFFALKYLKSRPKLICLETHGHEHINQKTLQVERYINPHIKEIIQWMNDNRYQVLHQTESDTLFAKKNLGGKE